MNTELSLDPGTVVLVVDDDPLCCAMIRHMLEPDDVLLIEAGSIEEAWRLIAKNTAIHIDLVLLDRGLPDGDGLELLQRMRRIQQHRNIPVIIQSGLVEEEDVEACMRAEAYHYLAKPFKRDMLRTLARVAIREHREQKYLLEQHARVEDGLSLMLDSTFEFRSLDDVKTLAPFLARFFPNPESATIGASELMVNAVEHGNLEIGYDLKGSLLETNAWNQEITRRLCMPEYLVRRGRVRISRLEDRVELLISDDGNGFDWEQYVHLSQDRLFDLHGRGIALAREHCFDGLEFLGNGSQVRCWSWLTRGR